MMSSTTDTDPFLTVQSDVLAQLPTTRSLFTSYLRILSLSRSPSSPELLSARTDIDSSLSLLSDDLQDLQDAVAAVTADPYKYGLEIEEVVRRRRLVEEVGAEIEGMREEMVRAVTALHQQAQSASQTQARNASPGGGPDRSGAAGGEDYNAAFEQQQQLTLLREQDTQLDSVFHTVGNLRQQASAMGRELEEQTEMLEHVDGLADRVGSRLQVGMKRMGEVARRSEDKWSSCCIGGLILLLVILLVLVLVL